MSKCHRIQYVYFSELLYIMKINFLDFLKYLTIVWTGKSHKEAIIMAILQQKSAIFSKFCLEMQKKL